MSRKVQVVKNAALQCLTPYGGDKIHKILEQLLSFGIIRFRSRCHY